MYEKKHGQLQFPLQLPTIIVTVVPFCHPYFWFNVAIKLLIPWQGQLQTLTTRSSAIAAETVPFTARLLHGSGGKFDRDQKKGGWEFPIKT